MTARLDNQLSSGAIEALEEHLSGCEVCRNEWRRLNAVDHLFSSARIVPAPRNLQPLIMARIRQGERTSHLVLGGLTLALTTTAVVVLAFAPIAVWMMTNVGFVPTVIVGGARTLTQLVALLQAQGRLFLALLDSLAVPLTISFFGCFGIALVLNALWVAAVRRMHPTR